MLDATTVRGDLTTQLGEIARDPVDLVLDLFQALREGTHATLETLDVSRRGKV